MTDGAGGAPSASDGPRRHRVELWIRRIVGWVLGPSLLGFSIVQILTVDAPIAVLAAASMALTALAVARALWSPGSAWVPPIALAAISVASVASAAPSFDGVGTDAGGPAFTALTMLTAGLASALPLGRAAVTLGTVTAVYVIGRTMSSAPLLSTLDEVVILSGTAGAIAVLVQSIRQTSDAADRLRHRAIEARIAAEAGREREEAAEAVRRVLHDDLMAALVLLSWPDGDPDRAVAAARSAIDALADRRADDRQDLLAATGLRVDLTVDGDVDALETPPDVVAAFVGAATEALRNIERHTDMRSARVSVRAQDGCLRVEIVDEGPGFDPRSPRDGFGINSSIVGRLRDVGGEAEIRSAAGTGTTVALTWSPPELPPVAAPASVLDLLPTFPRDIAVYATAYIAGPLWLAVRYGPGDRHGVVAGLIATAVVALTLLWVRRDVRRPVTPAAAGVTALVCCTLLVIGLANTRDGSLRGFESWVVGLAMVPLVLMAFHARAPLAFAAAGSYSLVVTGWAVRDPTISPIDVLGPQVQPWGHVAAMVGAVHALRWINREGHRQEEEVAAARLQESRSVARVAALGNLTSLRDRLLPFLRGVSDGALATDDPAVRTRAGLLAQAVRDEMTAPTLLDDRVREALWMLRSDGGTVRFRGCADLTGSAGQGWRTPLALLFEGLGGHQVTVSHGSAGLGLVVRPGVGDRTLAEFGDMVLEHDVEATVVSFPADPGHDIAVTAATAS